MTNNFKSDQHTFIVDKSRTMYQSKSKHFTHSFWLFQRLINDIRCAHVLFISIPMRYVCMSLTSYMNFQFEIYHLQWLSTKGRKIIFKMLNWKPNKLTLHHKFKKNAKCLTKRVWIENKILDMIELWKSKMMLTWKAVKYHRLATKWLI